MFNIRNISLLSYHKYLIELVPKSKYAHPFSKEELRDLQMDILSIYLDIQSFCEKHNLTVMMAYGSALGAVRHQGFIPWDDDIDVLMPHADYEFLIAHFEDEYGDKYWAVNAEKSNKCHCYFGKIISKNTLYRPVGEDLDGMNGTFVDIFPIEKFPKSKIKAQFLRLCDLFVKFAGSTLLSYKNNSPVLKDIMKMKKEAYFSYWLRRSIGFLFSFVSYQSWAKLYNTLVCCREESAVYHDPTGDYRWKGYSRDILFPAVKTKFEGYDVYVPHKVKEYLQSEFGKDYMSLPPIDKRPQHYAEEFKKLK